jgi:branched-chain amino acid transport system substrate-binding protein
VVPLVVAVAVVAAACGGRDSDSSSSSTTAAATKAFINPADDCTDYQGTTGITGDTIKVGTIRPVSGPYAVYDQVTTGLGAYFAAQNAAGGITAGDGKKYMVELVKEDDGYDPGRTPAVAK